MNDNIGDHGEGEDDHDNAEEDFAATARALRSGCAGAGNLRGLGGFYFGGLGLGGGRLRSGLMRRVSFGRFGFRSCCHISSFLYNSYAYYTTKGGKC